MLPCVLMERARDAVRLLDAHFFYVRAATGLLFYARALHALFAFLLYSPCPLFVRFFYVALDFSPACRHGVFVPFTFDNVVCETSDGAYADALYF